MSCAYLQQLKETKNGQVGARGRLTGVRSSEGDKRQLFQFAQRPKEESFLQNRRRQSCTAGAQQRSKERVSGKNTRFVRQEMVVSQSVDLRHPRGFQSYAVSQQSRLTSFFAITLAVS